MTTIGDLKEIINELTDKTPVIICDGKVTYEISFYVNSENELKLVMGKPIKII